MEQLVAFGLLGIGLALLAAGIALGGLSRMPLEMWMAVLSVLGLVGIGKSAKRLLQDWLDEPRLRRTQRRASPLAASLVPQLLSDYTPVVVEAAEQLGTERDTTAVPGLLRALEYCVDTQRPGWRDRAEALANALGRIGDCRALDLLYRLENVRGIGFIPAIRSAITRIEPQATLLRPGCIGLPMPETLLRPAQARHAAEEPKLLLRAAEAEEP
ncbi:MAG TPA: hypothetical protein VFB38_08490 [Chthonomonadaceae bacterium]|nr:hypothetical protein [Chthonomonadaceae bacterium]